MPHTTGIDMLTKCNRIALEFSSKQCTPHPLHSIGVICIASSSLGKQCTRDPSHSIRVVIVFLRAITT